MFRAFAVFGLIFVSQIASANQCAELFAKKLAPKYASLEEFGLETVEVHRAWRTDYWTDKVQADFLDAWAARHGSAAIPKELKLEYYNSVLAEMNFEPRLFSVRSQTQDPILEAIKNFHDVAYRRTRGRGAYPTFFSEWDVNRLMGMVRNGVPALNNIAEQLHALDAKLPKVSATLLTIAENFKFYQQDVLKTTWTRESVAGPLNRKIALSHYKRETSDALGSLDKLIGKLRTQVETDFFRELDIEKNLATDKGHAIVAAWRNLQPTFKDLPKSVQQSIQARLEAALEKVAIGTIGFRAGDAARLVYLESRVMRGERAPLVVTKEVFNYLDGVFANGNVMNRATTQELFPYWINGKIGYDPKPDALFKSMRKQEIVVPKELSRYWLMGTDVTVTSRKRLHRDILESEFGAIEGDLSVKITVLGSQFSTLGTIYFLKIDGEPAAVEKAKLQLKILDI